jgi:hypothetical protein
MMVARLGWKDVLVQSRSSFVLVVVEMVSVGGLDPFSILFFVVHYIDCVVVRRARMMSSTQKHHTSTTRTPSAFDRSVMYHS